jgi:hypothetical protein
MAKITLADFKNSFSSALPPADCSQYAKALWYASKGDWNKSHEIVQDIDDQSAARIHAFLHRQEGDISNARYWYNRAHAEMPSMSLDEEWEYLASQFI